MKLNLAILGSLIGFVWNVQAQNVQGHYEATTFNYHSSGGVPLSSHADSTLGDNGKLTGQDTPTLHQFQSWLSFGAVAAPKTPSKFAGDKFGDQMFSIGQPLGPRNENNTAGEISVILLRAEVGSAYLSRQVSFFFGSVIPVPSNDIKGALLSDPSTNTAYWYPQPYFSPTNIPPFGDSDLPPFYWSPHARQVYAVQSGPIEITWRRRQPDSSITVEAARATNAIARAAQLAPEYLIESGFVYPLYTVKYVVSGSVAPGQPVRKIFWNQGTFQTVGYPVTVPQAGIEALQIVYSATFKSNVTSEVRYGAQSSILDGNTQGEQRIQELRTLWFERDQIYALNQEGRVFVEVLGKKNGVNGSVEEREQLGIEIVDVIKQASPVTIDSEIGEVLPSDPKGGLNRELWSSVANPNIQTPFAYTHVTEGTDHQLLYGIRETHNLNDLLVFWVEAGVAGIRWPVSEARYKLRWPDDVAKYSHYLRPRLDIDESTPAKIAQLEEEAKKTAVRLNAANSPFLVYQDPLDKPRAKLVEDARFYTVLTPAYPAHRSLLRYTVGPNVAFERVFSWLDEAVKNKDGLKGSVAEQLSSWRTDKTGEGRFDWPDALSIPRIERKEAEIGRRIEAPDQELGARSSDPYLAGHINQDIGTSFNIHAYIEPFDAGFDDAAAGAIIPVNTRPGNDKLEVWWFRKQDLGGRTPGFNPVYWPSVLASYSLKWPANPPQIVLASNAGSGPLDSLEGNGSIYYQNDRAKAGYNPNEEHALVAAGQVYALRDDLNLVDLTKTNEYSSEPYVLLEYKAADHRPAMTVFKVFREKPESAITFNYSIEAGTILQPPMPLPLLGVPFSSKLPGEPQTSLNQEISFAKVQARQRSGTTAWDLTLDQTPFVRPFEWFYLTDYLFLDGRIHQSSQLFKKRFFVTEVSNESKTVRGFPTGTAPYAISYTSSTGDKHRFAVSGLPSPSPAVNDPVVIAVADGLHDHAWEVAVTDVGPDFIEVNLNGAIPDAAKLLILPDRADLPSGFSLSIGGIQLNSELQLVNESPSPSVANQEGVPAQYLNFTFQDRKGSFWAYRGPHSSGESPKIYMRFYYKTLPGFYFPTKSFAEQPAPGVITPYLRPKSTNGFVGDPVFGSVDQRDQQGTESALSIGYTPYWPADIPVLNMAETLTRPKRGLPAVRGQTSLEVLYQQSLAAGTNNIAAVLVDPTREKQFLLGDPKDKLTVLTRIPDSIKTSLYKGNTYFPNLPPHLSKRFFLDPNRGKFGALVFKGEFSASGTGDDYLLLNVLSEGDIASLTSSDFISDSDPERSHWLDALESLQTVVETFKESASKPGAYVPDPAKTVTVNARDQSIISSSETAVDSYALTATGPGTGYVTLISGNGRAFTPSAEPVAMHIVRVTDSLYRGELKVVKSDNPLSEKLTLQQVVDLAGRPQEYDFEWRYAPPTADGKPPEVYSLGNELMVSADTSWTHIPFPLAGDRPGAISTVAAVRTSLAGGGGIEALSKIPFNSVTRDDNKMEFSLSAPTLLDKGNVIVMRDKEGREVSGHVIEVNRSQNKLTVQVESSSNLAVTDPYVPLILSEGINGSLPQSIISTTFTHPGGNYAGLWLSMDLDDFLGAKVYLNGQLVVVSNTGNDTPLSDAPPELNALRKAFLISPVALAAATGTGTKTNLLAVELFSKALPGTIQPFSLKLQAIRASEIVTTGNTWLALDPRAQVDGPRATLGEPPDVVALADNYVIMRYRATNQNNASWVSDPSDSTRNIGWSDWTTPQLAEGWIKRVLAGINPFNQRISDFYNHQVDISASLVSQAGSRWEGDVALNLENINSYGLIEIYETVLRRGRMLSIDNGINYGPANDALLLAAGYLNDLYMILGNEAWADAANPTIGIGTKDNTYGDIATSLFAFQGQEPSLLEEELALLRGRDDSMQPGVNVRPVYNRLYWNYTRGINAGEVIYALNYNIHDDLTSGGNGIVDADDARRLYPQGHGDAYGHYLTAVKGYYQLLLDKDFTWVPKSEAVLVLGQPVQVDYMDERKFAAGAAFLARAGRQVFDLTWKRDYSPATGSWDQFGAKRQGKPFNQTGITRTRYWGVDHWASRTAQGNYINWIVGNAILPDIDPDPAHEGIQKIDRTTVPELAQVALEEEGLQTAMDNAEGGLTPLGLPSTSVAFDLNPKSLATTENGAHFEQIYQRAKAALNNAVAAFDDSKDITRLMRSEEDALDGLQADVNSQELAFTHSLIELYGTPYTDDIGPGKTYAQGYAGPDFLHYMYVDQPELTFGNVYDPQALGEDGPDGKSRVFKIDVETFPEGWFKSLATSFIGDITKSIDFADSDEGVKYITYALGPNGFTKPASFVGGRQSPGQLQQAISDQIRAHDALFVALKEAEDEKANLDVAMQLFEAQVSTHTTIRGMEAGKLAQNRLIRSLKTGYEIFEKTQDQVVNEIKGVTKVAVDLVPKSTIAGVAAGGDLGFGAVGALDTTLATTEAGLKGLELVKYALVKVAEDATEFINEEVDYNGIEPTEWTQTEKEAVSNLSGLMYEIQSHYTTINEKLRAYDDAQRAYKKLIADGDRVREDREAFRQRAAALIQGFRTRDAAFRIFRNEKLERYKTLFDLAGRYAFLAAQAYDYDTGLLYTDAGRSFLNKIVQARALGVVRNGEPQFGGSSTGDPGLSSALAEMKADWDVLKGRLGFNNPDNYGTTLSLRSEEFRILPGTEGDQNWKNILQRARRDNLLEDSDVRRYCMQIDSGDGLAVPGLVLEFSTTVAKGLNLFGQELAPGDHNFSPSSFATKIFSAGIALEGYKGMDNPSANGGAVQFAGSSSPTDPSISFLDTQALAATPYIYLIPVGVDSMRSPPLGDVSVVRSWNVDDVTVPLPFNIGGSDFSTKQLWVSGDSLSDELFSIRKHQAFRPVSSVAFFPANVNGITGDLTRSQFTNTRLIGRSVWNSKWKIVIPGYTLLRNPNEGVDRFIATVKDVKLFLATYSYSGN